jgi:hypothetical protein
LSGVAGAGDDVHATAARLLVTVGPPCPAAERRVRLGDGDADVDYVVGGDAATVARDVTRLLREDA